MASPTYAAEGRKPHRHSTVEEVTALVRQRGIASVAEVAEAFDVSTATARRQLDGAVARGDLIRDEYDADGHRLGHLDWRYAEAS